MPNITRVTTLSPWSYANQQSVSRWTRTNSNQFVCSNLVCSENTARSWHGRYRPTDSISIRCYCQIHIRIQRLVGLYQCQRSTETRRIHPTKSAIRFDSKVTGWFEIFESAAPAVTPQTYSHCSTKTSTVARDVVIEIYFMFMIFSNVTTLRLANAMANPSVYRLWRACTLLRGLTFRGYFVPYYSLAIYGNSPTKNHEDRPSPRGSPPTSKSP